MIIKKVNIIAFGGLKNKVVEFDNGINIIYGENETGKSTIQSFIKIWLYGFSSNRGKDLRVNERLRYMPLSGEVIKGELWVEFKDKTYIIKRTFGKTKKEDTSLIINALTGDEVKDINSEEPGKYFLNINRSTFIKTLFIRQLGSEVNKDKDEEILDKILNSVGVSEGDVTVDKAFIMLDNYKKYLSNIRKSGYLDKLRERYSLLLAERHERYNLAEENLDNEKELLNLKEERENTKNELSNLDCYKKYLKKIKLQEEYEDIIKYSRKKEELQKKEKNISKFLINNNDEVLLETVDLLKEEYSIYLRLLDLREKAKVKLDSKLDELKRSEEPLKEYKYIEELGEDISKELIKLKIEQDSLREKIEINRKIDKEITLLKNKAILAKEHIGDAYKIEDIRKDVESELEIYEEKLKSLKFAMENKKNNSILNNKYIKVSIGLLAVIFFVLGLVSNSIGIRISLFTMSALSILLLFLGNRIIELKEKSYINSLKKDVEEIELNLEQYNKIVGVIDFGQLIRYLKLYNEYLGIKENIEVKISEKYNQKELLNLDDANDKFNANKEKIDDYLKISKADNIDVLIDDIYKFEEINKNCNSLKHDAKSDEEVLRDFEKQLEAKKDIIFEKLKEVGLEGIDIIEVGEKLDELKRKINQKREIHRSLLSVEETYLALIKDKDIEKIKNEIKEIIDVDFKFSFKDEEEVDSEIKRKSNELIQIEKDIKDLENKIENLFKGRRNIAEIEDEITNIEYNINEEEKNLKAVELAKEVLNQSYDGLRNDFGPILNKKVNSLFKEFSDNKYSNVLVSDKYEMKLVYNDEVLSSQLLSNGANDQLYLALRVAFIEMIFNSKDVTLYLDDAFTQYDDNRIKTILSYLASESFIQILIFTCQNREESYLKEKGINHNYILL